MLAVVYLVLLSHSSLVNAQSGEVFFDCPEEVGLFPDTNGCESYFRCNGGIAEYMECSQGLHFNVARRTCDLPALASCEGNAPLGFGPAPWSSVPTDDVECETPTCPCVYPSTTDCAMYYRCEDGIAYKERCSEGLMLNPKTLTCDFEHNVDCTLKTTTSYENLWSNEAMDSTTVTDTSSSDVSPLVPISTTSLPQPSDSNEDIEEESEISSSRIDLLSTELYLSSDPLQDATSATEDVQSSTPSEEYRLFNSDAPTFDSSSISRSSEATSQISMTSTPQSSSHNPNAFAESTDEYFVTYSQHKIVRNLVMANATNPECSCNNCKTLDPSNCSSYFVCRSGKWVRHVCPNAELYNAGLQTCDLAQNVRCHMDEEKCLSADGYYPDVTDCSVYVHCKNNKLARQKCPSGLVYNAKSWTCDLESNVQCGDLDYTTLDEFRKSKSACPCDSCLLPDASDCSKYFLCSKSIAYEVSCSKGLMFNWTTQTCDFAERVTCPQVTPECKDFVGFIGNSTNCSNYLYCIGGMGYKLVCPPGLHFSLKTHSCVPPCEANCDTYLDCPSREVTSPVTSRGSGTNPLYSNLADEQRVTYKDNDRLSSTESPIVTASITSFRLTMPESNEAGLGKLTNTDMRQTTNGYQQNRWPSFGNEDQEEFIVHSDSVQSTQPPSEYSNGIFETFEREELNENSTETQTLPPNDETMKEINARELGSFDDMDTSWESDDSETENSAADGNEDDLDVFSSKDESNESSVTLPRLTHLLELLKDINVHSQSLSEEIIRRTSAGTEFGEEHSTRSYLPSSEESYNTKDFPVINSIESICVTSDDVEKYKQSIQRTLNDIRKLDFVYAIWNLKRDLQGKLMEPPYPYFEELKSYIASAFYPKSEGVISGKPILPYELTPVKVFNYDHQEWICFSVVEFKQSSDKFYHVISQVLNYFHSFFIEKFADTDTDYDTSRDIYPKQISSDSEDDDPNSDLDKKEELHSFSHDPDYFDNTNVDSGSGLISDDFRKHESTYGTSEMIETSSYSKSEYQSSQMPESLNNEYGSGDELVASSTIDESTVSSTDSEFMSYATDKYDPSIRKTVIHELPSSDTVYTPGTSKDYERTTTETDTYPTTEIPHSKELVYNKTTTRKLNVSTHEYVYTTPKPLVVHSFSSSTTFFISDTTYKKPTSTRYYSSSSKEESYDDVSAYTSKYISPNASSEIPTSTPYYSSSRETSYDSSSPHSPEYIEYQTPSPPESKDIHVYSTEQTKFDNKMDTYYPDVMDRTKASQHPIDTYTTKYVSKFPKETEKYIEENEYSYTKNKLTDKIPAYPTVPYGTTKDLNLEYEKSMYEAKTSYPTQSNVAYEEATSGYQELPGKTRSSPEEYYPTYPKDLTSESSIYTTTTKYADTESIGSTKTLGSTSDHVYDKYPTIDYSESTLEVKEYYRPTESTLAPVVSNFDSKLSTYHGDIVEPYTTMSSYSISSIEYDVENVKNRLRSSTDGYVGTQSQAADSTKHYNKTSQEYSEHPIDSTVTPSPCEESTGIFYNKENCSFYYSCQSGKFTLLKCPEGLHFSKVKKYCETPCSAECDPTFDCSTRVSYTPSSTAAPHFCSKLGIWPIAGDCTKYLVCRKNEQKVVECPLGLHFNASTRSCDWPQNARCGEISYPLGRPSYHYHRCKCDFCLEPNEADCYQFHLCLYRSSYPMYCSPGLLFDAVLNTCTYDHQAQCGTSYSKLKPSSTQGPILLRKPYICPEENGLFNDPQNCTSFIQCSNWYPYIMQCPANLHFSQHKRRCDYPCDALCDRNLACITKTEVMTTNNKAKAICSCYNCLLPSSDNCVRYLECKRGKPRYKKCPHGQLFDATTKKCDWAHRVQCPHIYRCPERNGMFPHPKDSNKFVHCSNGVPHIKDCPGGLVFDTAHSICNWPSVILTLPPISMLEYTSSPDVKHEVFRCQTRNGYFSMPGNCSAYFHCQDYIHNMRLCPEPLVFNSETRVCDWLRNVDCSKPDDRKLTKCSRGFGRNIRCPKNSTLLPADDCEGYIDCSTGRACRKKCPEGLCFDVAHRNCDITERVHCRLPSKHVGVPSCHNVRGLIPDPTNVKCYYRCINSLAVRGCCSRNKVFNKYYHRCRGES